MLKKHKYLLITISIIVMGVVLGRNCSGKIKQPIPIAYNEQHIRKLGKIDENKIYWKERGLFLKKVDELEDSLAQAYQLTGENGIGWIQDAGDFVRIKLKLRSGRIVQFDNDLGGWMTIPEENKIMPKSPKIKSHPYGITLDMGTGDQILILLGTIPDIFLTLIYIGKDRAEVIFNQEIIDLLEIVETEKGYRLKGQLYSDEYVSGKDRGVATSYPGQQCEIVIENNQLSFHELPKFNMNRLKLPISFDKEHIISLKSNKMPVDKDGKLPARKDVGNLDILSAELRNYEGGEYWYDEDRRKRWDATPGDFCRIDFHLPSGVWVGIQNKEGGWVRPNSQIKLPEQSTKVIKHEYGIILDIGFFFLAL